MVRARRTWADEEDAIVRSVAHGDLSVSAASVRIGAGHRSVLRRLYELGLCTNPPKPRTDEPNRQYKRTATPPPIIQRGKWVTISHKADKFWRDLDGAPVGHVEAQRMVEAGIATTAHKRVDGGWDLLFRVLA